MESFTLLCKVLCSGVALSKISLLLVEHAYRVNSRTSSTEICYKTIDIKETSTDH